MIHISYNQPTPYKIKIFAVILKEKFRIMDDLTFKSNVLQLTLLFLCMVLLLTT